jgi:hypothetical protein
MVVKLEGRKFSKFTLSIKIKTKKMAKRLTRMEGNCLSFVFRKKLKMKSNVPTKAKALSMTKRQSIKGMAVPM